MALRIAIALVGVLGLALVAFGSAGAQSGDAIPGGLYTGLAVGPCEGDLIQSGPRLQIRLNDSGTQISSITVFDLVTPVGSFSSLSIPANISIGADGRFDQAFDPLNFGLAILRVEGQFIGTTVSGSFNVEADGEPQCSGMFELEWSLESEQPPMVERAPTFFVGRVDEVGDCGGGDIDITLSADRLSIVEIAIRNLSVHGSDISASATFDEGTVPVDDDGSFGWTYFPGPEAGQEIAVIGTVSPGVVSGAVTVSPSECGALPFESIGLAALGQGGAGPGSGEMSSLIAMLGAAGLLLASGGAVLFRRTRP